MALCTAPRPHGQAGEKLQGTEEVQQVLLGALTERVEEVDDVVGFGRTEARVAGALVGPNRLHEVGCAPIVEEEESLPETPERCRPELIARGVSLQDIIGECRPALIRLYV